MKNILILTIILVTFSLSSKAQNLIGSTEITITDSMKNQDSFNSGVKNDDNGSLILTYLNFMHKDGSPKIDDNFILMSSQFEIKNNKCIAEIYLYKDDLFDKFTTTFNSDTAKYKSLGNNEWYYKKGKLSINITRIPEQRCFMIQYKLFNK